jgi:hypothetical protein
MPPQLTVKPSNNTSASTKEAFMVQHLYQAWLTCCLIISRSLMIINIHELNNPILQIGISIHIGQVELSKSNAILTEHPISVSQLRERTQRQNIARAPARCPTETPGRKVV